MVAPTKMNTAQQLAQIAARARKGKSGQIEAGITALYPTLKTRAQTAAANGDVNMIISSRTDEVLFKAINNELGIRTLKENGFTVNSTTIDGAWVLDIYWDSGNPEKQVVDTTTT